MILGLDAGSRTVTEAEHLLHDTVKALGLPAETTVGCTHFVRTPTGTPHVACSLTVQRPALASTTGTEAPAATPSADVLVTGSPTDHTPGEDAPASGAPNVDTPAAGSSTADAPSTASASAHPSVASPLGRLSARDISAALAELGTKGVGVVLGDGMDGPEDLVEGAALAVAEHAAGSSGRIALFPGRSALTGTLTVAEVLARSAIDHVAVLAQAGAPSPDTPVATNDHVRPQWRDARVVLLTMPASGGRLMPAEVPNPTPCCADHA